MMENRGEFLPSQHHKYELRKSIPLIDSQSSNGGHKTINCASKLVMPFTKEQLKDTLQYTYKAVRCLIHYS